VDYIEQVLLFSCLALSDDCLNHSMMMSRCDIWVLTLILHFGLSTGEGGSEVEEVGLSEEEGRRLVQDCSVLLGMHPDQVPINPEANRSSLSIDHQHGKETLIE
jgi:hypothetical protein